MPLLAKLYRHSQSSEPQEMPHRAFLVCQLIGTVVPAVAPLKYQKLLSAVWAGRPSPTRIVPLVPSVMLEMRATWRAR